jgi:KDO2-lipid IV(A) lauroyltransferase
MILRVLAWIAERLSARTVARLGAALGAIVFALLRIRRAHTVAALGRSLSLPRSEATALARQVYRHLGRSVLELLRVRALRREEAEAMLGLEGRAHLDRLLAEGRGLLVLTGHVGSWDLLACAAGRLGYPLHVVTRSLRASGLNRFWMESRRAAGVTLHPARGSAAALVRALREGAIVALVLDQHEPGGEVVPFFGQPAATSLSLARLARATRAPVVPAFLLHEQEGHRLVLGEVMPLCWTAKKREDLRQATLAFNGILEQQIRSCPEQWLWLHRRWKV